jgi:hypothetical protein
MRLGTAVLLLAVLWPAVGCGEAEGPSPGSAPLTTVPSEVDDRVPSAAPTGLSAEERAARRAERQAERAAEIAERCDPLVAGLDHAYRITATPVARGTEIGLQMSLANRTKHTLYGGTAGLMKLDPGRGTLAWGGSSADEMQLKPGTTLQRQVWHEGLPPGANPIGERVTSFTFYTYLYAPKPGGTQACYLPATIEAPRGLVDGHTTGRWTAPSELPWQR